MVPQDRAGFSADLLNRINPVGGQGEIFGDRLNGNGDYGAPLTTEGLRAGGFDVPSNIWDQIHQGQATQGGIIPPSAPPVSGLGLEGVGGLGRPEFQNFLSSDRLAHLILPRFSQGIQSEFANQKFGRSEGVDPGAGYYDGGIQVGRGTEGDFGQSYTEQVAIHELLHAISDQRSPYKEDLAAGFPTLKALVSQNLGGLPRSVQQDVQSQFARGDDWHLFTSLAQPFLMGVPLPPALAQYFAALKP